MKKVCLALLCLALAGCQRIGVSNQKPQEDDAAEEKVQSFTCSHDQSKMEFEVRGDKVIKTRQEIYWTLEELGIADSPDKEQVIQAINDKLAQDYGAIDGVETEGSLENGQVRMVVTIDYERADTDQLIEAGLLEQGEMESQYVSLEKSEQELMGQGFACQAD